MKIFNKQEIYSLIVIFLILIGISWPNFTLSLRRARDQTRRDDIGNIQTAIYSYFDDYGSFPMSTTDGKMIVCKGNDRIYKDSAGKVHVEMIPCNWGHDTWINLTPGVSKTYMQTIPGDPSSSEGASYVYFSNGRRFQLMASLEGKDEPEYDAKLEIRNVKCGVRICNMGRVNNVPLYMPIEEYEFQIYCGAHPNDIRCIKD